MSLESRLLQAHVELQITPKDENGAKAVSVARRGSYDIRLVEPPKSSSVDVFPFWLELYDHDRKLSLDSGGADDLEEALRLAEHFLAHAQDLAKK